MRVSEEERGVTVHDVVIVGGDDAPILALRGLRLKAMSPVPEDEKFSLQR